MCFDALEILLNFDAKNEMKNNNNKQKNARTGGHMPLSQEIISQCNQLIIKLSASPKFFTWFRFCAVMSETADALVCITHMYSYSIEWWQTRFLCDVNWNLHLSMKNAAVWQQEWRSEAKVTENRSQPGCGRFSLLFINKKQNFSSTTKCSSCQRNCKIWWF